MACLGVMFFFFKQKTADGMRISDWSSVVCSSDLDFDDADVRDRQTADPRVGVVLQPGALLVQLLLCPPAGPDVQPFFRNVLEAVVGGRPGLQLGDLLLAGRIAILVQRQPDRKSTRLNSSP